MAKLLIALALLIGLGTTLSTSVLAQQTEDHQAIRSLFEREQEAWRSGDGAQVLSCYAESWLSYGIPFRNNKPNFLKTEVSAW